MTNVTKGRAPVRLLGVAVAALLMALALAGCMSEGQSAVHRELNQDRQAHSRRGLPTNDSLNRKAQAWAEKMARERRLSHSNLASGAPSCWRSLAENVGVGPNASSVQAAFMRSSGHRNNVLGGWTHVGVGYARGGNQVYVVQVFMTC